METLLAKFILIRVSRERGKSNWSTVVDVGGDKGGGGGVPEDPHVLR